MDIIKNQIGERLKELRQKLGFNQKEFAKVLSTSASYISEIESGKSLVSVSILYKLHKLYSVDINYILYGEDAEKGNEPARAGEDNSREIERLKGEIEKLKHELAKRDGQIELLKSMLREAERAKGGGVATFKSADDPKLKTKSEAD